MHETVDNIREANITLTGVQPVSPIQCTPDGQPLVSSWQDDGSRYVSQDAISRLIRPPHMFDIDSGTEGYTISTQNHVQMTLNNYVNSLNMCEGTDEQMFYSQESITNMCLDRSEYNFELGDFDELRNVQKSVFIDKAIQKFKDVTDLESAKDPLI